MIEHIDMLKPASKELKQTKNTEISNICVSYRGFTSIDQEMEREIAMQWFEKSRKSQFFRGNFLYKGTLS